MIEADFFLVPCSSMGATLGLKHDLFIASGSNIIQLQVSSQLNFSHTFIATSESLCTAIACWDGVIVVFQPSSPPLLSWNEESMSEFSSVECPELVPPGGR